MNQSGEHTEMIGIHRISGDFREFIQVYCFSKNLWNGVSVFTQVGNVEPVKKDLGPGPQQKNHKKSHK